MQDIVKFSLLLILDNLAVLVSILIFAYFIAHRIVRSKPKNHVWLVLLSLNFAQLIINLPMPMSFHYLGRIWPATDAYCIWWTWYEYSSNAASLILMAWASIERHFFVFNPRLLLGASWKKWTYHIGPIILCILWPISWYFTLVVISPSCINVWDFDYVICGVPCFLTSNGGIYGILDLVFNIIIPLVIIISSNITLIARVIYEKISRRQIVHWRRHRKMAFQLWLISSLYLSGWLPFAFTQLIQITLNPSFLIDQLSTIFFMVYFIPLLLPIVCLGVFPDILKKIRNILARQRRNRVETVRVMATQLRTNA